MSPRKTDKDRAPELIALGRAIKAAREARGREIHEQRVRESRSGDVAFKPYTQEDLAHDADVTTSSIGRLESGRGDARWSTVWAVKEALGVTMEELGRAIETVSREKRD